MTQKWDLLSNHGAVLLLVGKEGRITARAVAARLDLTERSVMRIVQDLVGGGLLTKKKIGRRNEYTVNLSARLRGPDVMNMDLASLLKAYREQGEGDAATGRVGERVPPARSRQPAEKAHAR